MSELDGGLLLNRAINPSWVQQGFPTSQAFQPTRKDEDKLSTYDNGKLNPQDTQDYFTKDLKLGSAGIMQVTVEECVSIDLNVYSDPDGGGTPHPAHVATDFSAHSKGQQKKRAGKLRDAANVRGWLLKSSA